MHTVTMHVLWIEMRTVLAHKRFLNSVDENLPHHGDFNPWPPAMTFHMHIYIHTCMYTYTYTYA